MTASLWRFWITRGYLAEGREHLARTLEGSANAEPRVRARALDGAGNLACAQGDYGAAIASHEESLEISQSIGDRGDCAWSLNNLGNVANLRGEYESARTLYEASLDIFRDIGNRRGVAGVLANLSVVARELGGYEAAHALAQESLELLEGLGDRRAIANSLEQPGPGRRSPTRLLICSRVPSGEFGDLS